LNTTHHTSSWARRAAWLIVTLSGAATLFAFTARHAPPDKLLTTAERSGFTATARYDDVVTLCDNIAEAAPTRTRRISMGTTEEGREIPLLILADPPIATAEEAAKSGKLVVLLFGNIHAGEVCGKEALPMLAREILGLDHDVERGHADVTSQDDPAMATPDAPAVSARIIDIGKLPSGDDFVTINEGAKVGLKSGMLFDVVRAEQPIATVSIMSVEADQSIAKVTSKTVEIRPQDRVINSVPQRKADAEELSSTDLLKHLIIVIAPIYNADSNEKLGPIAAKRPGQVGPEGGDGIGTRENKNNLDLNRDYIKLEAAETRALVRFLVLWDPAVVVDTHTTNGSHHRYIITYAGPTNPAGDSGVLAYSRDKMLPALQKSMDEKYGIKTFHYGNFGNNHTQWTTYPDLPRYGAPYLGLRNRLGILSEAYSYAPFKNRVLATRDFCREILLFAAQNKRELRDLMRDADERVIAAGRKPAPNDLFPVRSDAKAFPDKVSVLGFEEEDRDGKRVSTGVPRDYEVELINDFQPSDTVRRPFAYLLHSDHASIADLLQLHGVKVEELREDLELDVETYTIEAVTKAMREFQGHSMVDVKVSPAPKTIRAEAGWYVVRTGQPLGNLAAYMLEPRAADSLTSWNFFDSALQLGEQFPVMRIVDSTYLLTAPAQDSTGYRTTRKRLTSETVYGPGASVNLSGSPIGGLRWVKEDAKKQNDKINNGAAENDPESQTEEADAAAPAEFYLQTRDGVTMKIDALTGRAENAYEFQAMTKALADLPTIGPDAARSMVGPFMNMNPARTAAIFERDNDLYYATLSGEGARLTSSPETEEFPTFSPDGSCIAFVRSNDLYVVDVKTRTERALTMGGTDLVRNAKNDWVYYEELYNRNWRAFWWSPDSKRLAFLQLDSTPVPRFKLQADHAEPRLIEDSPYPEPGEPNPNVRLGVVTASGGDVRWADLSDYNIGHYLITGVGWFPAEGDQKESRSALCYVQDRTQTWLDLLAIPVNGGKPTRLMREKTEAWVEPQGDPKFLKDGSFILASERTGYRHLYLFDKAGKLKNPITEGEWEATSIQHVDEDAGVVYVMGTADGSVGQNLYSIHLDGTEQTRLTQPQREMDCACGEDYEGINEEEKKLAALERPASDRGGGHSISFSPSGRYFIDNWSDYCTPTRVALFDRDGNRVRTLDSNPVHSMNDYERGSFGMFTIPARDGFELEASVLLPPDLDRTKKYPVWLMTYAGPHAPSVFDSWQGGRIGDEVMASSGIIVFRVDPRSASGKGAKSAWSAYKQLGVQELADLEDSVKWLCERPYVDAARVGISGGSYGGFMTAYALTHSKVFSAGVAVASVTDWRDYDSIYTERYMGMPQDNAEGYDKTSVVKAARNLHGKLLIVHGSMDDNVHMLNSLKLVRALQNANKQFEFMLYPGARHGVGGNHYRTFFADFVKRAVGGPMEAPESTEDK